MGPLIIDVLYQTFEQAAIDQSCKGGENGGVLRGDRCSRFVYQWNHLCASKQHGCLRVFVRAP